ncbi:MAG: hypothetical protein KGZ51_03375 [Erysipelothrix sp.]|nr:hypothetical protein [Erysipelothrix sp.]
MKQIKTKEVDLRVDKFKVLLGHKRKRKEHFLRQIYSSFQKRNSSDYQEEVQRFEYIKLNEREVNLKENTLYLIHPWIDLDDELKLGSKSIFLKHIETLLMEVEFDDQYMMMKQVIGLFESESLNNKHQINFDSISLRYQMNDLNTKLFSKLIEAIVYKDDAQAISIDINYDETVMFIIKIINEIAKQHYQLEFWLVVVKSEIDTSLLNLIAETERNVHIILDSEVLLTNINIDNIVYFGNTVTDFSDPQQCYELMTRLNQEFTPMEEFKTNIQHSIEQNLNNHGLLKQF